MRRRFPDLEMSHQHLLPAESQAPRQHLLSAQSQPWTQSWPGTPPGCTFSGDYAGAPLVRIGGSCATQNAGLSLENKGITSVKAGDFQGMGKME